MPRQTIKLPGKHHRMPVCMKPFYASLGAQQGVRTVGIGRFINKGNGKEFSAQIKLYDEATRTMKVHVNYRGFQQDFWVTVDPEYRGRIEGFVRRYRI